MLFSLATDKNKSTHLRQGRTEKLGKTTREVSTSKISHDSLSAIRSHEFSRRSPSVGRSVDRSVGPRENFAAEKVVRGMCSAFSWGGSISIPIRRHPSVDGGNKAPNKRFPSRWTERTNGKSDISMPRRPPSSCYLFLPHRTLAVCPSSVFSLSILRPPVLPYLLLDLRVSSFYFLIRSFSSTSAYAFAHP